MTKLLWTIGETADALGISRSAVYGMLRTGDLPGVVRLNRSVRISADALAKWINEKAAAGQGDGLEEEREGVTSTSRPERRRA